MSLLCRFKSCRLLHNDWRGIAILTLATVMPYPSGSVAMEGRGQIVTVEHYMWKSSPWSEVKISMPIAERPMAITVTASIGNERINSLILDVGSRHIAHIPGEILEALARPQLNTLRVFYSDPVLDDLPRWIKVTINYFDPRGVFDCQDSPIIIGNAVGELEYELESGGFVFGAWNACGDLIREIEVLSTNH